MMRFLGVLLLFLLACAIVAAAFRPMCTALRPAEVRQMHPRFDEREDRDLLFLKVYQRRDGIPYECKTWISRELAL